MNIFTRKELSLLIATLVLLGLTMGGCATSIKYLYDTKTSFPEQKSYAWAPSWGVYRQDPLLETNVRALADQFLGQKGFTKMPEKPDLLIAINYESDIGYSQYGYQLRMLTLNIYRPDQKELVWRGTASGTIHTDAASGDLKQAVQGILANFPPK